MAVGSVGIKFTPGKIGIGASTFEPSAVELSINVASILILLAKSNGEHNRICREAD